MTRPADVTPTPTNPTPDGQRPADVPVRTTDPGQQYDGRRPDAPIAPPPPTPQPGR